MAAIPAYWPPQYSLNGRGEPQGFAIDVLEHLAGNLGFTVRYKIADTFPDAIKLLETGEADLIPNSGILSARLSDCLFTPPVETFRISVFVRSGQRQITGISSLHGKTVGAVEQNAGLFLLRSRNDLSLEVYPNVREALLGLLSGTVDAVVYPDTVFEAVARKHNVGDKIAKVGSPLSEIKRALRFRADRADLHALFSPAVSTFVTTPDYEQIYLKWYGEAPPFWSAQRVFFAMLALLGLCIAGFLAWQFLSLRSFDRQLRLKNLELNEANASLEDRVVNRTRALATEMDQRKRSQRDLESFFNQSQSLNMIADDNGSILRVNTAWEELIGYSVEELLSRPFLDFVHPDDRPSTIDVFKTLVVSAALDGFENRYRAKDGAIVNLRWSARWDGKQKKAFAIAQDVTSQKQAEDALKLSARVFEAADEGILITDPKGIIVDVNPAFTQITGYSADEAIGRTLSFLKSGRHSPSFYAALWKRLATTGHWRGEIWNRAKDGTVYPEMLTISAVKDADGTTRNYAGLFSDITRIKEHEDRLKHLAHYDALTNLPNRILLADRLTQAMARANPANRLVAVAFIDLDGFKSLNDSFGHPVGDQVLLIVADRMRKVIDENDTFGRFGGDEFLAVLSDLKSRKDCTATLERLLEAAAEPVEIDNGRITLTASIGVTFYPQTDEMDADQLQRQADQAMYQAKLAGKNRYQFFDIHHDQEVAEHFAHLGSVKRALEANEFDLYFQPKVNLSTGRILGSEVLLRWNHPERGLLGPAAFLPQIDNHPILVDIGNWVLDHALSRMEGWAKDGFSMPLSVNVSAQQLMAPDFFQTLQAHLARHPAASPSDLELEILETSTLNNLDQISTLIARCKTLGVSFALDDFGTGYSSLAYLKRLPVTTLKIDQDFVRDLPDNRTDQDILKAIVGFGKIFNLDVIAEGVETDEHGRLLLSIGCPLGQGYAIARPMPAGDLPGWCLNWTARSAQRQDQRMLAGLAG
ncbi:hypothetical protein GCM10011316_04960 [Roseibium aquae]|uniref:PAS domain S-box-containing protein/diguanylate cyclase (GGDEF)-like protein n=1 Tax=Roseibium aquae TaxID=1323746 RepID=A0A916TA26_9HYPH|nr:EAL domain-containing protein [Roseibium aquae]GGB35839.1 hypothetical protein GCM10011316_04960 [Roseibium aquae]